MNCNNHTILFLFLHFIQTSFFSVSCNGCADLLSASKEAAVGMAARIKLFILLYIQY